MSGASSGWFVSSFSCWGAVPSSHPELLSSFCACLGEGDLLPKKVVVARILLFALVLRSCARGKSSHSPTMEGSPTFKLSVWKEENVTCLFVSFLEADERLEWTRGRCKPLLALHAFLPTSLQWLVGELDSETGWG